MAGEVSDDPGWWLGRRRFLADNCKDWWLEWILADHCEDWQHEWILADQCVDWRQEGSMQGLVAGIEVLIGVGTLMETLGASDVALAMRFCAVAAALAAVRDVSEGVPAVHSNLELACSWAV
jgi:hypothetical protein